MYSNLCANVEILSDVLCSWGLGFVVNVVSLFIVIMALPKFCAIVKLAKWGLVVFLEGEKMSKWYWFFRAKRVFVSLILIMLVVGCSKWKANKEIKEGDALFAQGNYEGAIAHYSLSLEEIPENGIAYIKKGDAYLKMEEWSKAKREFAKAIELLPESLTVYERFSDTLLPVTLNDLKVDNDRVQRDSTGRVIGLSLNGLGVSDPKYLNGIEVYSLTLERLMLNNNELEAIDLIPLSSFSSLKNLLLQSNKLTEIDLSPLAGVKALEILNLKDNQIKSLNIKPLTKINALKTLNFMGNQLESIDLQAIGNLANLEQLELQFNSFSKEKCSEIVDYVGKMEKVENFTDPCKKPKKKDTEVFRYTAYLMALNTKDGKGFGDWFDCNTKITMSFRSETLKIDAHGQMEEQRLELLSYKEIDNGIKCRARDKDGKYPDMRWVIKGDGAVHFYIDYSNISYVYQCFAL